MIPSRKIILVSTDLSDVANQAIQHAYADVDPGGEVHLIHVIEHQDQPNPLYAHYSTDELNNPDKRKEVAAKVEAELTALIPSDTGGKSVETKVGAVFHPHVAEGILKEASERKADGIVVGSHGRSALSQLLMGSVAETVLRGSNLPVLIVPHKKQ
ncbi:MAG: universal stress protein [SAR324 cluster bacterium]|nr:universal stress protein [SAR324 cluster bacterium]